MIKDIELMPDRKPGNLSEMTAGIGVTHLSHNQLIAELLPTLIQSVYRTLSSVDPPEVHSTSAYNPAVPVKKSVFPDFIVCLEDGKKLKMLKRYLQTRYGMTPDDYRKKWRLPRNYPMVAPNYASTRSALAKQIGLGRKVVQRSSDPVIQVPTRHVSGLKP